MSQEYTEDKEVSLTTLSSGRRVLEALLILVALFAVWLMVALLSFNPSDPSWSQTAWHEPIRNLGGRPGAWLADTLFFIFGVMAYTIPVIVLGGCWFAWRHRVNEDYIDYFAVAIRLIGALALVLTSCGLAAINADDIWYFASGGVIGSLLSTTMVPLLNSTEGTIALLFIWAAGLTLFTGWSWVVIAEKIGSMVLAVLTFASNSTRRDDTWQDDDDYEEHDEYEDGAQELPEADKETRRARILRGALARKHRVREKFASPLGRKTDEALFSGRRMDDPDDVLFSARGIMTDAEDVLFSGQNIGQVADNHDPLFSGAGAVNLSVQKPVAPPVQQAPVTPVIPQAPVIVEAPQVPSSAVEWQTTPGVHSPEPVIDPEPDAGAAAHALEEHQSAGGQLPFDVSPAQGEGPFQAFQDLPLPGPQDELPVTQKAARPPLWHFEEVEAQRAREREQLAAWYQPIPEVKEPSPASDGLAQPESAVAQNLSPPDAVSGPDIAPTSAGNAASFAAATSVVQNTESATPVFGPADDEPRPQVKEGIGPQLPRPNRVRVPTRRELASYGIKLPSQRMAEEKAREEQQRSGTVAASQFNEEQAGVSADAAYAAEQDELARQYAAQQQQRYGASVDDAQQGSAQNAVYAAEQDELAREYAAQQQQRYGASADDAQQGSAQNAVYAAEQDELAREYAAQQQQRYGASADDAQQASAQNAAYAAEQDELVREYAAQQQKRYGASVDDAQQASVQNATYAAEQDELAREYAAQQQRYGASVDDAQQTSVPDGSYGAQQGYTVPSAAPYGVGNDKRADESASSAPLFMPETSVSQHNTPQFSQSAQPPHQPESRSTNWTSQYNPQGEPLRAAQSRAEPQPGNWTSQYNPHAEPLRSSPVQRPVESSPGHSASLFVQQPPAQAPQQPAAAAPQESLLHPLLMRNGDSRPVQKPTTPLPSLDLLTSPPAEVEPVDSFALQQMARLVEARLADFRIKADVVNYSPGPVITRFELNLAPGVKAARISNLSRDLARSLSTVAVRVVEVIPGKPYVGLELPNQKRQTVYLREVLDCPAFKETASPLSVVLGKDIAGEPVVADLAKMPHLLVAGTTGSGKSVGVNAMILSMLFKATPEEVRFIMIDPKMLELSVYEGIPHLLTEVVTDMKDAANALRWSVNEMERRYKLMSALGVRNLAGYNEKILEAERMGRPIPDPYWKPGDSMDASHPVLEKLPYIVVLVDEFADLMMAVGKKVEELIARLAQKARAAGIHLVLATQRPSVDVITGLIKANIPTRIAFTVSSKIDSRTILDQGGAESLLGMGDMLYSGPNSTMPVRVHGAFVRDEEVHAVVQDWKARGRPQYIEGITSDSEGEGGGGGFDSGEELDPLFDQAVAFVVEKRKASISGVQRQFRIGYNRAARIVEQMESQGIVSEQGHNGNREVLAPPPFE